MARRKTILPQVRLSTDELFRGPWVYARHVEPTAGDVAPGSIVEVLDHSERFIGHAFHNPASDVRLRWLARGRRNALDRPLDHFEKLLRRADAVRRKLLRLERHTDAYRIAHAEGDDLPGLVVDRLADHLVCEHHALGFFRRRGEIEEALGRIYPGLAVLHRVPRSARGLEGFTEEDLAQLDPSDEESRGAATTIHENELEFDVHPGRGHKTGWFCDQRENRRRVRELVEGRNVLDLFCNLGGFALNAARAGARSVRAVDLDESALELASRAASKNGLGVTFEHADAFDVLRAELRAQRQPDVIVVDPHKFIRGRANQEAGRRKYLDLNALALEAVRPGGTVLSFSCSGALDLPNFLGTVFAAARRADRAVRLLRTLEAGPDHPQRPEWPRSRYLKGCLLAVDP